MKFNCISGRLLVLLPLLFGWQSGHAQTKPAAAAGPVVSSTLDVCEDAVSGNWRYSGVVSVMGKAGDSGAAVSYGIQNSVSSAGYANVLQLPKVPGTEQGIFDPDSGATVYLFAGDAAPLTLGTLRNTSSVQLFDKNGAGAVALAAGEPYTAQVCGCPIVGCTRTQGYWKSKPGVVWPKYKRDEPFFSSGLTWQALFETPPRGNAYIILAHQYMAAALNTAAVTSKPPGVQSPYFAAQAWFSKGATLATCPQGSSCAIQKTWAATLDVYNNGLYPGGPPHCPD